MDELARKWSAFIDSIEQPEVSIHPDRAPAITHQDAIDTDVEFRCPICEYDLRGLDSDRCPECGTPIGYEPITAFVAEEYALARSAAQLLDRHKITNMLTTRISSGIGALIGLAGHTTRVAVPRKFFFEAIALLDEAFNGRSFRTGEQPDIPQKPDWRCPKCNKSNPGSFEICWNCHENTPDDPADES